MDHALRRARLAQGLSERGVEALLVTRLPNVRYLTGFTGSNGQLVVGEAGAVFLTDGRYEEQASREVPDLERAVYRDGLAAAVRDACRRLSATRLGFEAAGLTVRAHGELLAALEDVELVALGPEVERLRWVKDGEELVALGRAQELTDLAFDHLLGLLREGVTEREVALELEVVMRRAGADGTAFEPIVAFGEHAAEPHHRPTDRPLSRGDVVKLDFGAEVAGYHADMTRTVALGEPPAELREAHGLVLRAQRAAVAALAAGVPAAEVDRAARAVIADAGYGERFPHGLGHGVGLEVHEGPTLRASSEDVLPAGAVVTVEPGIYLPGLGGIRVEDMVVVEDGGGRVLGASTRELVVL